jgi:hypothetical protein
MPSLPSVCAKLRVTGATILETATWIALSAALCHPLRLYGRDQAERSSQRNRLAQEAPALFGIHRPTQRSIPVAVLQLFACLHGAESAVAPQVAGLDKRCFRSVLIEPAVVPVVTAKIARKKCPCAASVSNRTERDSDRPVGALKLGAPKNEFCRRSPSNKTCVNARFAKRFGHLHRRF